MSLETQFLHLNNREGEVKQAAVDDTLMSRKAFFAQVDKGLAEIKRGEGICFTNKEEMNAWLNNL